MTIEVIKKTCNWTNQQLDLDSKIRIDDLFDQGNQKFTFKLWPVFKLLLNLKVKFESILTFA